ncbi:alkaline phosphatase [uncultured Dokdonia sp.]|uniref:alkaline phosphatase n=1 Tax=uncultured Dokdonia sp. TaxID=575653 RepID=UPI0026251A87|nr:alkaline phosphatase [uncultured Dokdonia sp.]
MSTSRLHLIAIASLFLLFSCATKELPATSQPPATPKVPATKKKTPKNIIMLIADGTGLSQISATQFYHSKPSNYERFKHIGLIKTSSSSDLITDSAAGATSFASGIKTYNGAIGVNTDTIAVPTILEELSERGYATGVIATSTITHATPASFYAHVKYRKMEEEIAEALTYSSVDFFAGGGLQFFNNRTDKKDLLSELSKNGFVMATSFLNPNIPTSLDQKYGFLLADGGMPKMIDGRGSFLYDATTLGLSYLKKNNKGFFLMVEGSQIDWGGHANDADYLIGEMIDFDVVLGKVLDFAKKDKNTLVIVTADHETGGFTLASDDGNYNKIKPSFSTGGHSATMVPVFAYGPGAEEFSGIYENTEVYKKVKTLLKL